MSQVAMDSDLKARFAAPWLQFCEEFGRLPLTYGPLENIYAGYANLLETVQAKLTLPPADTSVRTEDFAVNDGFKVRVYHPPGATGAEPLGIYVHGGGWVICDVDSEDAICRLVCKAVNIVLLSVDYRLAPKHPFPAALDDCTDAFEWAVANAAKIGVRDTGIVLMGGSAGGNLAIGAALKLIDEGHGGRIGGVASLVPITVHPDAVPSHLKSAFTAYEDNADASLNTKSAMMVYWESYNPPPDNVYTSCLLHPGLKNLPKTYIVECGMDTLRDDARLFKSAAEAAGIDVRYNSYPGYPHWSWTFPSAHLAGHSAEVFGNFFAALNWMLEK